MTAPGVEQKATWLQIRQSRPDYVMLWGWGDELDRRSRKRRRPAIRARRCTASGGPVPSPMSRTSAEAPGLTTPSCCSMAPAIGHRQGILGDWCMDARAGNRGRRKRSATVLYMRGSSALYAVEGVRAAERSARARSITGEQVRWGLENLNLTQPKPRCARRDVMRPLSTSLLLDHMGSAWTASTPGTAAKFGSSNDWYQADDDDPEADGEVRRRARCAAEKKLTPRTPADCQS